LEILDEIVSTSGNENVVVKYLDLSDLESVREFAAEIKKSEDKLDILIHNGAVLQYFKRSVNADGVEMTMATNYYGPFLLTHLLVDLVKKSASGRVIYVSSEFGYRLGRVDLENLNPVNMMPLNVYYMSKCAIILSALELARRLKSSKVTVNCLHPGLTDSRLWRNVPLPLSILMRPIKFFWKTPAEGAQTAIYLAVSERVDGVTGKYFLDCREWFLNSHVSDEKLAKKLYEKTAAMLRIREL
jgi:NAD(P)-dependent dehydrogenase (short-subunit alcohol dehydrogenase family)